MYKMKAMFIAGLCILSLAGAARATTPVADRASFTTGDGIKISSDFRAPRGNKTIFVLLHGLGSNKEEWHSLEDKLAQKGYGFLAYDARGHGESILTADGRKVSYQYFGRPGPGSPWAKMPDDLARAVRWLIQQKKIPPNGIGLIGASLGANVCLLYAAKDASIPVIVALSPGMDYAGLAPAGTLPALADRRVCFAASPGDTYAYESAKILYNQLGKNHRAVFVEGEGGHGVQMFNGTFEDGLLRWIASGK